MSTRENTRYLWVHETRFRSVGSVVNYEPRYGSRSGWTVHDIHDDTYPGPGWNNTRDRNIYCSVGYYKRGTDPIRYDDTISTKRELTIGTKREPTIGTKRELTIGTKRELTVGTIRKLTTRMWVVRLWQDGMIVLFSINDCTKTSIRRLLRSLSPLVITYDCAPERYYGRD